jgi:hypothetical protein
VAVAVEERQLHDLALIWRQQQQRSLHAVRLHRGEHRVGGRRCVVRSPSSEVDDAPSLRLLAPDTVDGATTSDRHHPGGHRPARSIEADSCAPELDEHLLGHVLGKGRVAHHLERSAVDERRQLERSHGRTDCRGRSVEQRAPGSTRRRSEHADHAEGSDADDADPHVATQRQHTGDRGVHDEHAADAHEERGLVVGAELLDGEVLGPARRTIDSSIADVEDR